MTKKVELLAPAGSLEKAKIALMYGADAVYVGGQKFSLRARASNFSLDDLENIAEFAKKLNKKVYVTMNILPHDDDLEGLEEYLLSLEKFGITGIISSSLFIIETAIRVAPSIERHVSTQMSITNSEAIRYWADLGVDRCVLAREVTMDEIELIAKSSPIELEVFIHGGMCASYSGRCVLSNHLTERDANRGGCAHSCRWNYNLFYSNRKISTNHCLFSMGSKDLMAIDFIPRLIDAGVASLKIEGRMKSAYYLATVVRCYRQLIDYYYEHKSVTSEIIDKFVLEIRKAENRQTATGFLPGIPGINAQLFDTSLETPTKEYVGFVLNYDEAKKQALIEQRNYFEVGDTLEFFGPNLANSLLVVDKIIDAETMESIGVARHPLQNIVVSVPFNVSYGDMIRKVSEKKLAKNINN